jgi:hypothetical protein
MPTDGQLFVSAVIPEVPTDCLILSSQIGPLILILENKLKIGTDTNIVADHIRYDVSTG